LLSGRNFKQIGEFVAKTLHLQRFIQRDCVIQHLGKNRLLISGLQDNIKWYNDTSQDLIDAIIDNKDNEGWPAAAGKIQVCYLN
jgi:hypothetical protein